MQANKIIFAKLLFRVLLTLLMLLSFTGSETFAQWSIEAVDSPKYFDFLTSRAIVTDSAGNPHIVYGGDNLYYAYHDGTEWHHETVDNTSNVGENASIAIDSKGYLHISYSVSHSEALKYATNSSGSWVATRVDDNGGRYSSIATDSSDTVHISHLGMDGLKYTTNTSGSWVTEVVGGSSNYTSIAVDSFNKAHIKHVIQSTFRIDDSLAG